MKKVFQLKTDFIFVKFEILLLLICINFQIFFKQQSLFPLFWVTTKFHRNKVENEKNMGPKDISAARDYL